MAFIHDTLAPQLGIQIDDLTVVARCRADARGLLGIEDAIPDLQEIEIEISVATPASDERLAARRGVARALPDLPVVVKPNQTSVPALEGRALWALRTERLNASRAPQAEGTEQMNGLDGYQRNNEPNAGSVSPPLAAVPGSRDRGPDNLRPSGVGWVRRPVGSVSRSNGDCEVSRSGCCKRRGVHGPRCGQPGTTCIADPGGAGAMGVHYLNPNLTPELFDPAAAATIDAATPELLVFAPGSDGRQRLVALEYLTLKGPWDAHHAGPPSLFGHRFNEIAAGNRFDLPAFYSLHAWVWDPNPTDLFAQWNPRVTCP